MHPSLRSLLDLHDINKQRRILQMRRKEREQVVSKAAQQASKAAQQAEAARKQAHEADALQRQYERDIAHAEERMVKLREQQANASSNKQYVTVINGIEEAKNLVKIRKEQLNTLKTKIQGLENEASAAEGKASEMAGALETTKTEQSAPESADTSEQELDRQYNEKRQSVDPLFLEAYERLVSGGHKLPLLQIDPVTRCTPFGNVISHNQMEQIRKGNLVIDHASAAILFIND